MINWYGILIFFICLGWFVQACVVIINLMDGDYSKKKDFLVNLIPLYWIYEKFKELD